MHSLRSKGNIKIHKDDSNYSFKITSGFSRRKLEKSSICFGIIPSNKNFRASNPKLTVLQLLTSGIKGNKNQLKEYAENLIRKADINITISETAACLSGGMLQRLILERELAKNPEGAKKPVEEAEVKEETPEAK